jgi:hypothetical protein
MIDLHSYYGIVFFLLQTVLFLYPHFFLQIKNEKKNYIAIFFFPRPCAMTICGQLARAKAATDL